MNNSLTHLYGLGGLIPGLIGIFFSVQQDATWKEYVLVGSGWFAAITYAILLYLSIRSSKKDYLKLGKVLEKNKELQKELNSRNKVLEYLASQSIGQQATPRKIRATDVDNVHGDTQDD